MIDRIIMSLQLMIKKSKLFIRGFRAQVTMVHSSTKWYIVTRTVQLSFRKLIEDVNHMFPCNMFNGVNEVIELKIAFITAIFFLVFLYFGQSLNILLFSNSL